MAALHLVQVRVLLDDIGNKLVQIDGARVGDRPATRE
jgi:hypothetical protein